MTDLPDTLSVELRKKIEREIKQMAESVSDTQHRLERDEFAYTTARLRDDKDITMTVDKVMQLFTATLRGQAAQGSSQDSVTPKAVGHEADNSSEVAV